MQFLSDDVTATDIRVHVTDRNHLILADFYTQRRNASAAATHTKAAASIKAGILDLFWDPEKLAFYDFNLTSNARNNIWSTVTFFPLWNGIVPAELTNSTEAAFGFFSAVNLLLNRYNGTVPVTWHESGLQWDAPNAWPNHQHVIVEAFKALPTNVTRGSLPTLSANQSSFDLIPAGQLDVLEAQLPGQPIIGGGNATKTGPSADINKLNGTVVNGGKPVDGESWSDALQRELVNRYFASAFCSWYVSIHS